MTSLEKRLQSAASDCADLAFADLMREAAAALGSSQSVRVDIPVEEIQQRLQNALLRGQSGPYGDNEPPLAGVARAVIRAHMPQIERAVAASVDKVLNSDDFTTALAATFQTAIREAIAAKAGAVVRSLSQTSILSLLGQKQNESGT